MDISKYLVILIFLLASTLIIVIIRFQKRKKELKDYLIVLNQLETGDENPKIFIRSRGIIGEIGYKTNKIIAVFKDRIAELKKSEQLNKQLLTSLSHDVRTPLTSLLGYLDAIDDGVVTGDERIEYIRIARNKAYNLKSCIDTLFEWSKLESKERILHFETTDINECTRNIIIGWLPMLEQKKIRFNIDVPEEQFLIELDQEAYARIVNNLIQNAVSHSRGTCLEVEIKPCEAGVCIKISDNGQGMQEAKLPFVFERLYKCDDARSDTGSGLGLAITKALVLAHKGTITVMSSPNEKTTFIIRLPLRCAA